MLVNLSRQTMGFSEVFCIVGWLAILFSKVLMILDSSSIKFFPSALLLTFFLDKTVVLNIIYLSKRLLGGLT